MWFIAILTTWYIIEELRWAILVLNTSCSNLGPICERVLTLQVKVIVLHHAVMVSLLPMSGWMRYRRSCRAETWLTSCKNVTDAFATSLVLRITPLAWRVSSSVIALDLDILQALIWACFQTVVASVSGRLVQVYLTLIRCVVWWSTEAEDSCLRALNISEFSVLTNLTLSFSELVLRNGLVSNRSWLSLYLVNKALISDLNRQHFWVLICIERVLVHKLLFRWSWVRAFLLRLIIDFVLWNHTIFRCIALPCEYSLLLWSTTASVDGNNNLATFIVLLVNCIVSIHFYYLPDLNRWVPNVAILIIILLLKLVLMTAVICASKKGCWFGVRSLLIIRNWWSERIAASFWTLFGSTIRLVLRVMQSLTTISTFCIHFLFMREWMHTLTFDSWVLSFILFIVLSLNSVCSQQFVWMWAWRSLIMMIFLLILHWFDGILLWVPMMLKWLWLWSSSSLRCCLLWTQVKVIDDVCNIGHSIWIILLICQFVWELRSSGITIIFIWQSWRSDLSARVCLSMILLHLLVDHWVVGCVDLELVCVMWWFGNFNILAFHLNFWWHLLWDFFFAIFSNPRINEWLLFLIYFSLACCLFIGRGLSLLGVTSILDFCFTSYLVTSYTILIVLLHHWIGTLIRVIDGLRTWLRLFQLPGSFFSFSFLDSLFFIVLPHLLADAHSQSHVYRVIMDEVRYAFSDIVDFREFNKHRNVFIKCTVVHIIVPR